MSFLGQNLVYPESAVQNNIQGKVLVKFVVTKEGNVANVEVIQSVDPALNAEAVRVVSLMKGLYTGYIEWREGECVVCVAGELQASGR